jgi:hypothetical protein
MKSVNSRRGETRNAHRGFVAKYPPARWIKSWKCTIEIVLIFDDAFIIPQDVGNITE